MTFTNTSVFLDAEPAFLREVKPHEGQLGRTVTHTAYVLDRESGSVIHRPYHIWYYRVKEIDETLNIHGWNTNLIINSFTVSLHVNNSHCHSEELFAWITLMSPLVVNLFRGLKIKATNCLTWCCTRSSKVFICTVEPNRVKRVSLSIGSRKSETTPIHCVCL